MQKNLGAALAFIFADEGGFAVRDSEPGGAVNMGISMLVFENWQQLHGFPKPTVADLKSLGLEVATDIYRAQYATPVRFNDLPSGVDYAVLNTAVMQGVVGAIKLLQQALDVPQDGHLGVVTWNAVIAASPNVLVHDLLDDQMTLKLRDRNAKTFMPGWAARIARVAQRARGMMT